MTATVSDARLRLHRPLIDVQLTSDAIALVELLTAGGDARIALEPETGLNRYLSAPYPRDVLAYSSSTISDISAPAFEHLLAVQDAVAARTYTESLDLLRARIVAATGLSPRNAQIVFAPSGTDLEYVALAAVLNEGGVHNILLGADETGSGCIHSAHGRFFAEETALGVATAPKAPVAGCGPVSLVDIAVRCDNGKARSSAEIASDMAGEIEVAQARGEHALVHCVHGSKTGLVLPDLSDIDALQARFGSALTFVVDACQARITSASIAAYLQRGCIVLMTGSKFIGAPPFSGWALIPRALAQGAAPLPQGFDAIFRRSEWPQAWPGREGLPDSANLSLALRLEAALFELERFQAIAMPRIARLIDLFEEAVDTHCVAPLGVRRVLPRGDAEASGPIEMRTLITLDISALPGAAMFEDAQVLHRQLALGGIRLGQPVKCVRSANGDWGGTLRIGVSMPQMVRWAYGDDQLCANELARDMQEIARAIASALDLQAQ